MEVGDGAFRIGEPVARADAEAEWNIEDTEIVDELSAHGKERRWHRSPDSRIVVPPGVARVGEEREKEAVEMQQRRSQGAVNQHGRYPELQRGGPGAPPRSRGALVSPHGEQPSCRAANFKVAPATARAPRSARACP